MSALLLGAAAGVIGASVGWLLMSGLDLIHERAPAPPEQSSAVELPAAAPEPVSPASPRLAEAEPRPALYLQVAAYRDAAGADGAAAQLKAAGFPARIEDSGSLHRLLVGPVDSPDALSKTEQALQATADIQQAMPGPWLTVQLPGDANL